LKNEDNLCPDCFTDSLVTRVHGTKDGDKTTETFCEFCGYQVIED